MSKVIVSDTSCLIALTNIGLLSILKDLYSEIIITPEVKTEFGSDLPQWVKVVQVNDNFKQSGMESVLDKGEASSIALALEIRDSILIIDEIKGRKIAGSLNIEIIGTIGIILLAYEKDLISNVLDAIEKLKDKGFRLSDKLLEKLIEKYRK
jgi:predicted nucleic acid-binding protein